MLKRALPAAIPVIAAAFLGWAMTDEFPIAGVVRFVVEITLGVVVAGFLVWALIEFLRQRHYRHLRGVEAATLESTSVQELEKIWRNAKSQVVVFGMALSQLSRNSDIVRDTVKRGVDVRVIMINPDWVSRNRTLSDRLAKFYDTNNIVGKCRDSHARIARLRDDLNSEFGSTRVKLETYSNVVMMSGTLADPHGRACRGVVEFHLFHAGDKRFRLTVRGYKNGRVRSLVEQVMASVDAAVRPDSAQTAPTPVVS